MSKRTNMAYERVEALRRKHPELRTSQLCARLKVKPQHYYNSRVNATNERKGKPGKNRIVLAAPDGGVPEVFRSAGGMPSIAMIDGRFYRLEAL